MKTNVLKLLLLVSCFSFAQLPIDQIAEYRFTNGDLTNLANPGVGDLTGGAVPSNLLKVDRFGAINAAIRSNAISRNGYNFTGTNNEISISFWVQGSAPTSGNQRIFDVFDTSGDGFSMRTGPSNTLIARFKNNGVDNQSSQAGLTIYNGDWHQVVFTIKQNSNGYDNSVYIDGVLHSILSNDVDSNNNSNFITSNATFRISPLSGSQGYFSNIDDIEIFDRAITAAEVQEIYNNVPTPDLIYVDATATGNNDGTSWTDAFVSLHDALNTANLSDQVWVAKGTYKPHPTDRNISFMVNTVLYGGFTGTETTLSDRDMSLIHTTNETILSGDLLGDDNPTISFNNTTRDDNSFHVVEVLTENVYLNDLTVQDGNADATSGDNRFGGGVFKATVLSNFTIKNCIIKNNTALSGAGLALTTTAANSNMIIDACIIENNLANSAAGIDYHRSGSVATMNITITNTLFKSNKTEDDASKNRKGSGAAAIRLRAYFTDVKLNAQVVNNTFVNNTNNGTSTSNTDYPVVDISRNDGTWGNIVVANNIFWDNTQNGAVLAKAIGRSGDATRFGSTSADRIVKNNTDEDNLSLITGTTATSSTNPNLNMSFNLTTGSPAIDSGDNSLIPAGITTDLLGSERILNTTVDRGAYEFDSTLSADNVLVENKFSIYPNPVASILNISINSEVKKVIIYNLQGQKILESKSDKIDVSHFFKGIYLLQVISKNNKTSTKKFIKN
ncbi:LamG-like jellyroll fold domain-containing protein [Polaribacter sp.]|uniref:LamG-like jellyroll fold domain-containing protein n=1 Tax=Polaribacter sp. TaxID=1920175 RepID=UPI003EF602C9